MCWPISLACLLLSRERVKQGVLALTDDHKSLCVWQGLWLSKKWVGESKHRVRPHTLSVRNVYNTPGPI